jgi:recombination protein RecR
MIPTVLRQLVQQFARLPGVGEKTALRFTLHMVLGGQHVMEALAQALNEARARLGACEACGNIAETNAAGRLVCTICDDHRRDATLLCVVAKVQDLLAMERSGAMRGRYFVLGRLLSPLEGTGPDELPIERLRERILQEQVTELVIATPPSVEGEATALHLAREFGQSVRVTRIASGVPHGGDLEYADPITLGRAMSGRRQVGRD